MFYRTGPGAPLTTTKTFYDVARQFVSSLGSNFKLITKLFSKVKPGSSARAIMADPEVMQLAKQVAAFKILLSSSLTRQNKSSQGSLTEGEGSVQLTSLY